MKFIVAIIVVLSVATNLYAMGSTEEIAYEQNRYEKLFNKEATIYQSKSKINVGIFTELFLAALKDQKYLSNKVKSVAAATDGAGTDLSDYNVLILAIRSYNSKFLNDQTSQLPVLAFRDEVRLEINKVKSTLGEICKPKYWSWVDGPAGCMIMASLIYLNEQIQSSAEQDSLQN